MPNDYLHGSRHLEGLRLKESLTGSDRSNQRCLPVDETKLRSLALTVTGYAEVTNNAATAYSLANTNGYSVGYTQSQIAQGLSIGKNHNVTYIVASPYGGDISDSPAYQINQMLVNDNIATASSIMSDLAQNKLSAADSAILVSEIAKNHSVVDAIDANRIAYNVSEVESVIQAANAGSGAYAGDLLITNPSVTLTAELLRWADYFPDINGVLAWVKLQVASKQAVTQSSFETGYLQQA